jgi:translation initiation factor IF-1
MVKNKTGGKSHRKMASKNANMSTKATLRLAKEKDETYGRVLKLLGNGMADVLCTDKKTRLLQIRKKFRGRNKRDNTISMDTMVLIGLRSWEARAKGKRERVDLLYVYSASQYDELKQIPEADIILPASLQLHTGDTGGFVFGEVETWQKKQDEEDKNIDKNIVIKTDPSAVSINPLEDNEFEWDDDDEDPDWINDI